MRTRITFLAIGLISSAVVAGARRVKAAPEPIVARPAVQTVVAAARAAAPALSPSAAALRSDVERLISGTGWRGDQWSVTVVSLTRGDTLVAVNPDLQLAPASGLKLFTTSAALYYLGPDYRYTTFLLTGGKIENGVLNGDVIVYGTGDPTFTGRFGSPSAVFKEFADTLVALGVKEVRGDVIGDASYFQGRGTGEGWDPSYIGASYAVTSSALSFMENLVTLKMTGTQTGAPVRVEAIPGGTSIAVDNRAVTGRGRSVLAQREAYEGPLVIKGGLAPGRTVQRTVPAGDPAQVSAAVMREALTARGIAVTGGARAVHDAQQSPVTGRTVFAPAFDKTEPLHVLAVHRSPPIIEVLDVINKVSHNMMAEQALRTVGRVAFGEGTVEAGYRAVRYMIECESPGDTAALHMFDGSGLSPLNRVSSRTMVRLLSIMDRSPVADDLRKTLNTAGVDRHLRRMYGTPAQGNLQAKTGTIDNVSSLSGYVRAADGEMLAFSIISNNVPSTWKAKRIEDGIGARLASFSRPASDEGGQQIEGIVEAQPPIPGAPASDSIATATTTAAATTATAAAATTTTTTTTAPAATKATTKTTAKSSTTAKRTYTVRRGDTLSGIAKKNGVSLKALQRANPGVSARALRPGKKLVIPR